MDHLTLFGLIAVIAMLVFYALEDRSPWFILAFAAACTLDSINGLLQCVAVRRRRWFKRLQTGSSNPLSAHQAIEQMPTDTSPASCRERLKPLRAIAGCFVTMERFRAHQCNAAKSVARTDKSVLVSATSFQAQTSHLRFPGDFRHIAATSFCSGSRGDCCANPLSSSGSARAK